VDAADACPGEENAVAPSMGTRRRSFSEGESLRVSGSECELWIVAINLVLGSICKYALNKEIFMANTEGRREAARHTKIRVLHEVEKRFCKV
jgi:hypothetical protein